MRNSIIKCVLLILLAVGISCGQKANCAGKGVFRAQDSLRQYGGWRVINKFYRLYKNCENVYTTEAFSAAIVKALAERWDSLPEMQRFTAADSAFLDFVLRRIDATARAEHLKKILANTEKCPKGCENLCGRIRKRTSAALAAAVDVHE